MTTPLSNVLRWPPDRFYLAVLDAGVVPGRRRPSTEQLGYLFESLVPQPLEELHAVYHPLGDRRYLACALPREALGEVDEAALSLSPDALPELVSDRVDPAELELLSGPYAPPRIRRVDRTTDPRGRLHRNQRRGDRGGDRQRPAAHRTQAASAEDAGPHHRDQLAPVPPEGMTGGPAAACTALPPLAY